MNELQARRDIVESGRRLWLRGLIAAGEGNISIRLSENEILTTPSGVCKGFLTPEMLCVTDLDGRLVRGEQKPSSELLMHLTIYKHRPDVRAVVHAHPPTATGFAVAGLSLEGCAHPEIVLLMGGIPLAAYGTPSTQELGDSLLPHLPTHDAFLLANHGAVCVGKHLWDAHFKMESLEQYARILLTARLLGGERPLPPERVRELEALRPKFGVTVSAHCIGGEECPSCNAPRPTASVAKFHPVAPRNGPAASAPSEEDITALVREVTRRVLERMK
ncbi:MAG: class II aldolase/adducin family protein [Abditibacteriales bacterium]|nr:class II aldolase/adducin family protein [Abditibacteriales bacterium]MDW8364926.1 class II aldolase/adducin family protein [Abditibacteriales bacterium]